MPLFLCAAAAAATDRPADALLPAPSLPAGVELSASIASDALAASVDGRRHGGHSALLSSTATLDTAQAGWWAGGLFTLSVQAIGGNAGASGRVGELQSLSNIAAAGGPVVSALHYAHARGDTVVRAGIMDMNDWFDANATSSVFLNAAFGITETIAGTVPTSTFPNAGWGVMLEHGPDASGWRAGVFQGDPTRRRSALQRGAMAVVERQWQPGGAGLRIGLGGWQRRAPHSALPRDAWGSYLNVEQSLASGGLFLSAGSAPSSAVPRSLAAGGRWTIDRRGIQAAGLAATRAWVRGKRAETVVEATLITRPVVAGLRLQPDLQVVRHAGGGDGNALVLGARLTLDLL